MPSAKSEFLRLCKEIKESYGSAVVFHLKGYTKEANDFSGIVLDPQTKHPIIHIVKRRVSYRDLILILLHEVGHIIDYRINHKTERSKLALKYCDYDAVMSKVSDLPIKVKKAILIDEDTASAWIPKLLKKHNVSLDLFEKNSIVADRLCYDKILKHRFKYGKDRTRKQERKWYKDFVKNPVDPLKYIRNLDNL